jgi:hypothetical protein
MYTIRCAEHAVLLGFVTLGELGLGVKLLPFVLASFEFLGGLDLLEFGLRIIGRLLSCFPVLLGQLWVDTGSCRDHARCRVRWWRSRRGRGKGCAALNRRTVGLAFLGDRSDIFGPELLDRIVTLELDDVDGVG